MENKQKVEVATQKPELEFNVNDTMYRIIDFDVESSLDLKLETLEKYMEENKGTDNPEEEKDVLYANAQQMLREFKNELRECSFNFYLDRSQYRFLTELLIKKMEYDVNQVFIAIELTDLLGTMKKAKHENDVEQIKFACNATQITYIYHLIATHKVKGLSKDTYTFSKILLKIGELSKLISYYDTSAKNMVDTISKWVYAMSPVSMEEAIPHQPVEQVEDQEV